MRKIRIIAGKSLKTGLFFFNKHQRIKKILLSKTIDTNIIFINSKFVSITTSSNKLQGLGSLSLSINVINDVK